MGFTYCVSLIKHTHEKEKLVETRKDIKKTPAKHRDIFRYKNCNASARVRTHDFVPAWQADALPTVPA